jgi:hypothetical protein
MNTALVLFTSTGVAGIVSIIFLQKSREIFLRCLGVFVVFLSILSYYILIDKFDYIVLSLTGLLSILAFLSDKYLPTLRSWFLYVPQSNMRTIVYTLFFSSLFFPIALEINIAHALILGAFLGSVIASIVNNKTSKNLVFIIKSALGTLGGFYGISLKLIISIQIMDIFIGSITRTP